jgi:hypothetical protein
VLLAGALVLGALLALPANGYMRRHARSDVFAHGLSGWMAGRAEDSRPVWSAPLVLATLTGDHLRRRLRPIPPGDGCPEVRARARTGYVVIYVGPPPDAAVVALSRCIARAPDYSDDAWRAWAPAP